MTKKLLEQDDQFVISYELLYILHWILKYESTSLQDLVTKAFNHGLQHKKGKQDLAAQIQSSEEMQQSIVEFFGFLEEHVAQLAENSSTQEIMHNNVVKTLAHIDPRSFDDSIVHASMMATAEKASHADRNKVKQQLLKELLRAWNPKDTKEKQPIVSH